MGDCQHLRRSRLNEPQKKMLMAFMDNNPQLQSGNYTQSFTKKIAQQYWALLAEILNNVPNGAIKSWEQWRRVCLDEIKKTKFRITMSSRQEDRSVATVTNTNIEQRAHQLPPQTNFASPMEPAKYNAPVTPLLFAAPSQVNGSVPVAAPVTPRKVAKPIMERKAPLFARRAPLGRRASPNELAQGVNSLYNNVMEYRNAKLHHFKQESLKRNKYEQEKLALLRENNKILQRLHETVAKIANNSLL